MAWPSWLSGMLGGAGSMLGTALLPGIGTALGGLAGGTLGGMLRGRSSANQMPMDRGGGVQQMAPSGFRSMQMPGGSQAVQMPNFTPEQQNILSQLLMGGSQGMQNLPSAEFEPIGQMYKTQYEQQILPALKEQYTATGDQRSGSFASALGGAGAGLAERLAGARQQFNMQNRQSEIARLMGMLQMGMQPQYQNFFAPPQISAWQTLTGALGPSIIKHGLPLLSKWLGGSKQQAEG